MKSIIVLLTIAFCLHISPIFSQSNTNNFAIENAQNLAWTLNDNNPVTFRMYHHIEPYFQGKIKIVSGQKNSVAVGIDENADGIFEKYIGIQTEHPQHLNEAIEQGEIIYTPEYAIINSLTDERRYTIGLSQKTQEVAARLPANIQASIKQSLAGYGLFVYTSKDDTNYQYQFSDLIDR